MGLWSVVFLWRLLSLLQFSDSPDFIPSGSDTGFYNDWALRILHGQWTDGKAFYGLPGYAYLLALLYSVTGASPWTPGFLQCGLDALTAVLIAQIALKVWNNDNPLISWGIALTAALGWMFFLPAQTFAIILMPTSWMVAAFWGLVWWILQTNAQTTWRTWLGMGLFLGAISMLVATGLMLLPLIFAAIWLRQPAGSTIPRRMGRLLIGGALVVLGFFAGCSPAWLHNRLIAHEPVLLSAHSGINYWIGNNPEATGYPKIPTGLRAGQAELLQDSITVAEQEAGHPLSRAEVSVYWSSRAQHWIQENRAQWWALLGRKFGNFWNAFQYDDLSIIALLRQTGVVAPGLRFGVIAAFALPGLFLAVWRVPKARWVVAAVLLHLAALMPVFITERYRLCAVPGLLLLASAGLWTLWEALNQRRWIYSLAYTGATIAAAFWVSSSRGDQSLWSLDHYNIGIRAQKMGDLATAQRELERAHAYVPNHAEINFALGNLWLAKGDSYQAKVFYRRTLELNPNHTKTWNNVGVIALEQKYWLIARRAFERAIQLEPGDPKTYYLLARACLSLNDREAARKAVDEALRLKPDQSQLLELRAQIDAPAQ